MKWRILLEIIKEWKIRDTLKSRIFWAFILSVIIHIFFFTFNIPHFIHQKQNLTFKEKKKEYIELSLVKKKPTYLKKIRKKDQKRKQIVNTELTGKKKRPKDSRFLGEKNMSFDRQTVGKKVGSFKMASKGKKNGAKKIDKKKKKKGKTKLSLNDLRIGKGSLKYKKLTALKKDKASLKKDKLLGIKTGKLGTLSLGQNNDFIEDVSLGDITNLNTVEFKFFGFYSRIRRKLEQYWGNSLKQKAEKLYKKGQKLSRGENYITSLKITIDKEGNILGVKVMGSSGYKDLDDAAIESFNKAGPFPNPPSEMVKSGQAILEWGFVVKS